MPDQLLLERRKRASAVLAEMSVVAEGTAMGWDSEGHGQAGSRSPISDDALEPPHRSCGGKGCKDCNFTGLLPLPPPGNCPPEAKSLHDHWACRFARVWHDSERLYYLVLLAEERLRDVRRTPLRMRELPNVTAENIATFRGSPAEAAARFARYGVTMEHVRTVRRQQRRDPETGKPWLWPFESPSSPMTSEAKKRAKEYAREVALEMLGEGVSQNRVSEATGIPGRTLRRIIAGDSEE